MTRGRCEDVCAVTLSDTYADIVALGPPGGGTGRCGMRNELSVCYKTVLDTLAVHNPRQAFKPLTGPGLTARTTSPAGCRLAIRTL
jgi:hypothetical protein